MLGIAVVLGLLAAGTAAPVGATVDVTPWLVRRPLVIAHAGGDLEAPHETMYAYKRAVAVGADVLEMDLRLSADRQLIVMHDDTLDRTTNASGAVRDLTVAQLQALDNAYWFVPGCWSCHDRPDSEYTLRGVRTGAVRPPLGYRRDDFTIPTFEQMLMTFPDRLMDVEIKDGPDGMAAAEALAARLNGSPQASRVVVVSFDDTILAHFHELAPDIATSPGLDATTQWFLSSRPALPGNASLQVPPEYSGIPVVSQQFVDDAHAVHMAVWVWFNGNDDDVASEWNRLLDLGVDGLITGKPAQLQAVLDARGQHFRTPLAFGTAVHRSGSRARVRITCDALAADRCRALLAIWSGHRIVAGAIVDLAPGTTRSPWLTPEHLPWERLARPRIACPVLGQRRRRVGDRAAPPRPLRSARGRQVAARVDSGRLLAVHGARLRA